MEKRYILALDEGTTSARALVYDTVSNEILSIAQQEFKQIYPKEGWVEHDPEEIWKAQLTSMQQVASYSGIDPREIYGIGITNQRETVVAWDKDTGKPCHNAIVWQCRRTHEFCETLKSQHEALIKEKTGLVVDPYFSASKIKWILENEPKAQKLLKENRLLVGTVDSFLIWHLTKGEVFVTDSTNASRTMLFNIKENQWDDQLLEIFGVPKHILPKVVTSSEVVGYTTLLGEKVPIAGIAGDQHAALFGQGCFEEGSAKNTYGTGCFLLMNTGKECQIPKSNLLTTIAWNLGGKITYALEGSIFNAGSAVQWIRDELMLIEKASDTERYAQRVKDNGGLYIVPAFTGLGAPKWDPKARGVMCGITRGVNKYHICRAVLEAMAYATREIFSSMEEGAGKPLKALRCDGGASQNKFLMQFQADILGVNIELPKILESTALGACFLAGLATGAYENLDDIKKIMSARATFVPGMDEKTRDNLIANWNKAVERALNWQD